MRPKLITSTDRNIHISKQEVSVSSQQGIVPKLITNEGTKLPKLQVLQITNQSSTTSELLLKSLQSKCKQKQSTSLGQEIPVHPWTKLATEIFHFENASISVNSELHKRFLIVCKLSSVTVLICDNGPCYTSQAIISVMKSYNVNHITSSLHYLQSNGLAEKYVQIV